MSKGKTKVHAKAIVKETPLVSVIIPVYNRFDLLEKCLEALPEAFVYHKDEEIHGVSYQVVLVDNGSDRAEADTFYRRLENVSVIRNGTNLGFPRACNLGARYTKSPLIFLLNSDVILDPGSALQLVQEMDDATVGVCGMKLVFPSEHAGLNDKIRPAGRLQHIGLSVNVRAEIYHPFVGWDENHKRVMKQRDVWAVTGAALMVRRSIWNKTSGLFEGYGLGCYEDCEICMAARKMGYNIRVVPTARGIHYTGASAEKYKIAYPMQNNYMLFMSRWKNDVEWFDGKIL